MTSADKLKSRDKTFFSGDSLRYNKKGRLGLHPKAVHEEITSIHQLEELTCDQLVNELFRYDLPQKGLKKRNKTG